MAAWDPKDKKDALALCRAVLYTPSGKARKTNSVTHDELLAFGWSECELMHALEQAKTEFDIEFSVSGARKH